MHGSLLSSLCSILELIQGFGLVSLQPLFPSALLDSRAAGGCRRSIEHVTHACRVAGAGGAQAAKDAAGNDVKASQWLTTHKTGELRALHTKPMV